MPCARHDSASSSPNIPSLDSEVVVTTRTSPACTTAMRGMDHQVVAGAAEHGDGAAGDARGGVDRPHVRTQQPAPPLRFVHGGDAGRAEPADVARIGAGNGSDDRRRHASSRGDLGEDALVRLGVHDALAPGVAHRLRAAAAAQVGVVVDEVPLRVHRLHRLALAVPDGRDVEQHLGLEVALLWLVRFEHEHRRRAEGRTRQRIAFGLREDACLERELIRRRVIRIVGIVVGVRQHELRPAGAVLLHQRLDERIGRRSG